MNEGPSNHRQRWLVALVLTILAVVPYAQTIGFGFVNYDDSLYVTDALLVQEGLTWRGVQWAFTTMKGGNWHPLTWLSHMADCSLFGLKAGGHHAVNILLHTANTILVWGLLLRLTGALWRSALVAALFAAHPLHVESVAWVAERKDVLAAFLGLLAMWSYVSFARGGGRKSYLIMVVWFVCSLMCKPMLVTLPVLLLLLDIWPMGRLRLWKLETEMELPTDARSSAAAPSQTSVIVLEKFPLVAVSILFGGIAVYAQHASKNISSLDAIALSSRISNAIVAYGEYLRKLLWPVDLAVFYPHPGTWDALHISISATILVAVSVLAFGLRLRQPWVAIGWCWFLGLLVPVIGIVQIGLQFMADRYSYLPSIGVFVAVAWMIQARKTAWARALQGAIASAIVMALAVAAWVQVSYWQDSHTLFERALAVTRNNYQAHQNLGNALEQDGDLAAAEEHYLRALEIRSRFPEVRDNLAALYLKMGQIDAALEQLQFVLTASPDRSSAVNSMGVALMMKERFADAESYLRRSVELAPDNLEAKGNYGFVLLKLGRYQESISQLAEVGRVAPQRVWVRMNLVRALSASGRTAEAVTELRRIIEIAPNFAPAQAALQEIGGPATVPPPTSPR